MCALGPPFASMTFTLSVPLPIQGAWQLVNISKEKAGAQSPILSLYSYKLTSKRRWEGVNCSAFLVFTSSFQCLSLALKYL
jgi:hypothetical protein